MQDPDEGAAQPTETLEVVGPPRPRLVEKVPARWRQAAVAVAVFAGGVAVGAVLSSPEQPETPPVRGDEHAVELVLFGAVPSRTDPSGRDAEVRPLRVEGALLMSGGATSTVFAIGALDRRLDVRARALPVTVSPTDRFHAVALEVVVRDCSAAARWTPSDRPFTIRWRDEWGQAHLDRAGDFGRSMAISLVRYIDAACDSTRPR